MCFMCGWPSGWAHPVQVENPPTKEEYIYLDYNTGWYPDQRKANAITLENPIDWPKTYRYVPANKNYTKTGFKGIHPPAPVYQGGMAGMGMTGMMGGYQNCPYGYGQGFAPSNFSAGFYGNQGYGGWLPGFHPTGSIPSSCYYVHPPYSYLTSSYYPTFSFSSSGRPNTYYWSAPGQPTVFPMPQCPQSMTAQAAAAASANAYLASMPGAPSYFVGATPADTAAQQSILYPNMGYKTGIQPNQLAPYKPASGQQFWCKETDGSWTLRTHTDIINGDVSPGHWERHSSSGYFYWVREVG